MDYYWISTHWNNGSTIYNLPLMSVDTKKLGKYHIQFNN